MKGKPILHAAMIHMISQTATNPGLSNRVKYPDFFRFWPVDNAVVDAVFLIYKQWGWLEFAMIWDNQYGDGLLAHFDMTLAAYPTMTNVLQLGGVGGRKEKSWMNSKAGGGGTDENLYLAAQPIVRRIIQSGVRSVMAFAFENSVAAFACALFKAEVVGIYIGTFGWFSGNWANIDRNAVDPKFPCKPYDTAVGLENSIYTVGMPWDAPEMPGPCSGPLITSNKNVGWFKDEYKAKTAKGGNTYTPNALAPCGGEGFTMDSICFIAHTLNKLFDEGYTPAELHNQNASTFARVGRVMQDVKFPGVSGFVGFPSGSATLQGGGDRAGSTCSMEQLVSKSGGGRRLAAHAGLVLEQVKWGLLANGILALLPDKEPKFFWGFHLCQEAADEISTVPQR
jgi:hypothetical protein